MFSKNMKVFLLTMIVFVLFAPAIPSLNAQTADELNSLKEKAGQLLNDNNYVEALPILEKLVKAEPENGDTQFYLGFALLAQSKNIKDKEVARQLVIRARRSFVKAKELGSQQKILDAFITSIPEDGNIGGQFSKNAAAEDAMNAAEAAFTQGKIDEALNLYQKAYKLDPTIYEAALFSGDMYLRKDDFPNAEIWYQKAIAVNPNRETAYRYSATPLMKQKKYDQARDRYVEAFIVEPYNQMSAVGISQWAEATDTTLAHPKIEIPTSVKDDGKGGTEINLDADAMLGGAKGDGSAAWAAYGATRADWRKTKFAKLFLSEKTYRHSLSEEADAIRSVLILAEADQKSKDAKNFNPSLVKLKKLNDDGLLEAYILLARPDAGIAQDYPAYLKQNRDKLRRYVTEYVITGGK